MNPDAYKRPNKPNRVAVTERRERKLTEPVKVPEILAVHRSTECHVTPADVAETMVSYLEAESDMFVLEPSAGTGNLVQALVESGHDLTRVVCIEKNSELVQALLKRFNCGPQVHPHSFEEFAAMHECKHYDRIIMNPPFKQVKQHVDLAFRMLGKDGILVALVPITYQHDQAQFIDKLPDTTFSAAKVNTKLIRIQR